jgi:hypothetical protein
MNAPDPEALPAVFSVLVASKVLGIGKNQTYDLIRQGNYPVRILKINGRCRVANTTCSPTWVCPDTPRRHLAPDKSAVLRERWDVPSTR